MLEGLHTDSQRRFSLQLLMVLEGDFLFPLSVSMVLVLISYFLCLLIACFGFSSSHDVCSAPGLRPGARTSVFTCHSLRSCTQNEKLLLLLLPAEELITSGTVIAISNSSTGVAISSAIAVPIHKSPYPIHALTTNQRGRTGRRIRYMSIPHMEIPTRAVFLRTCC